MPNRYLRVKPEGSLTIDSLVTAFPQNDVEKVGWSYFSNLHNINMSLCSNPSHEKRPLAESFKKFGQR